MNKQVIVMGSGGHAAVLVDAIRLANEYALIGFTDTQTKAASSDWEGIPFLGEDACISTFEHDSIQLVNGVGSTGDVTIRRRLFERWHEQGYRFASVIHPTAIVSSEAVIHEGVQLMAGVVIQTGAQIGANCIVNTRAVVDHHCVIGSHTHIAPGAVICGHVHIGSGVHIGAGAVVKQGVRIHDGVIVGAGAVVIRDVEANQTVVGIPAKEVRS